MPKDTKENKNVIIGVRVTADYREKLQKLADADGRTLSNWILFHLDKLVKTPKK